MTSGEGILWRWDGQGMRPLYGHASKASVKYKVGSTYRLDEVERSSQSHDHYFACLKAVWENLPENLPYNKWNNIDDMRRWALIQVGYCDEVKSYCDSEKDAFISARAVVQSFRGIGKYCMVEVMDGTPATDAFVLARVAKSQSLASMGKKDFEDSKEKVLRLLGEIIGVSPEQLLEEGREATRVSQGG